MIRILTVIVFCTLAYDACCARMKFEQGFNDAIYRSEPNMIPDAFFKREAFFPRDSILQSDPLMPQQNMMRHEPMYGGQPMPPKQNMIPQGQFMHNHMEAQPVQNEQILRREPNIRREPVMRTQSVISNEPIFQTGQFIRGGPVFSSEPSPYTFMVTPFSCSQQGSCVQNIGSGAPQSALYQVQQPFVSQHFIPKITCQKPVIKPTLLQPYVNVPRVQRFVRKTFRPMEEKVQISPMPIQMPIQMHIQMPIRTPVQMTDENNQEMNNFGSESVQFSNMNNYQGQDQEEENTSESATTATTSRSIPQMSNHFPIPQVSSIC